jgi:hypothetical protein
MGHIPSYAPFSEFSGKRGSAWTKSVVDAHWRSRLREGRMKMQETTVVNIRDHREWEMEGGVYIGRAVPSRGLKKSIFANPFRIGSDGDRDRVIEKYRGVFYEKLRNPSFARAVEALRGKMLVCWCSPADCHGRIIKEYLEGGSDVDIETD